MADANVLSETSKIAPDQRVMAWTMTNFDVLYLAAPVLSELRYGCAKLPRSAKRRELEVWLADLTIQLSDRLLPFDQRAAEVHGTMRARLGAMGRTCSPSDSYIAAIALSLGCPVATRNLKDFALTGVTSINPWNG